MKTVIWKKFVLEDTFSRSTPPSTNLTAKEMNISDEPFEGSIALITRAETNNGIRGYIEKGDYPSLKGAITYNDQFSFFLYHDYEFTTIKDHLSVVRAKNSYFQKLLDENKFLNEFIVAILNHVFSKEIFNFNFTGADYRYDREIILLPCFETDDDDFILEENGKHYSLAVEYIRSLMEKAKEEQKNKTAHLHETERAKYEAERTKYDSERKLFEEEYLKEKDRVVWKKFSLDELFEFDSGNQLSMNKKALIVSPFQNEKYSIALITQSEKNNGVSGYLEETEEISLKKMSGYLTYSMHFGLCFYHNYDFVLMDTHGSVFRLIPKENNLWNLMKSNELLNRFLGKTITKVCCNGVYNYSWLPNSSRVGREIILLPCLETNQPNDYIWEDGGRHFTLALNYISYVYLSGRVIHNQKMIDGYSNK